MCRSNTATKLRPTSAKVIASRGVLALVVLLGVVVISASEAKGQTSREIEAWLRQRVTLIRTFTPPRDTKWACVFSTDPLSDAELASLQNQVKDRPEHPRAAELHAEERIRASPNALSTWTLHYASPELWRVSEDQPFSDVRYADCGIAVDALWTLTSHSLSLADPRADEAQTRLTESEDLLRDMVSQGLSLFGDLAAAKELSVEAQSGDTWKAVALYASGGRVEAYVRAASDGAEPKVTKVTGYRAGEPIACSCVEVLEYRDEPLLKMVVAAKARRVVGRSAVVELRPGELELESKIGEVARMPNPTGSDPVRGRLTVVAVNDLRSSQMRLRNRVGDAWKETYLLDVQRSEYSLRLYGWIGAGLIVAVLVGIRIRAVRSR